jgi:LPXTG-motif cell wall-anchored protein
MMSRNILAGLFLGLFMSFVTPAWAQTDQPPTVEVRSPAARDVVMLTITDHRESVRPGEVLTYNVLVYNPFDREITISLVDHLPSYLIPIATRPEANSDPKERVITWTNKKIGAHADMSFGIQTKVEASAPHGLVLHNTADLKGENIQVTGQDETTIQAAPAAIQPTARTGESEWIWAALVIFLLGGSGLIFSLKRFT